MYGRKYTDEQVDYLISIIPGRSYKEIGELFQKRFGIEMSFNQVKSFIGNRKLNTGRTGRFEKGHTPANKGEKGVRMSPATEFKKGNRPHNYRPVGSERVSVDGYVEVKVADPKKWKMKHVVVWEAINGPVPKGYAVIFGDGNKQNFEPCNLLLVSRRQLAVMNKKGLIQNDAELTKTGAIVADLYMKMTERKNGK